MMPKMLANITRLLRPHQYVKNGFVLFGLLFSHQWGVATVISAGLAFLAFCAIASAVYVLNDILDVDADRRHPTKRTRPIASGVVSIPQAWGIFGGLVIAALGLSAWASVLALGFVMLYLFLNAAYSWRLKHVVILDVFIISAGFMLRILTGTVGIGIEPSQWLLLTGLMLTLFLGFAKRRAELLLLESTGKADRAATRRVLDDYSPVTLDLFLGITAACTILSYGLYTVSPETLAAHGTKGLFYTLPFVAYGIFRYVFLLHRRDRGNDAANDFLTDRHLLLTVVSWLAVTVAVLT